MSSQLLPCVNVPSGLQNIFLTIPFSLSLSSVCFILGVVESINNTFTRSKSKHYPFKFNDVIPI